MSTVTLELTEEELADIIEVAMDSVHDMDVTFRDYAEAAAKAVLKETTR